MAGKCFNGTANSSAPVPIIGLYIAAASALCAILILYDIMHGFIKKQRWLPCKLFKLNSVTLSLIGVVVKLTVDMTTLMPSALDQVSKLAGLMSLCIYMCYIIPSVPEMEDSTNMFALTILVVTVTVNICIQLSTGVIALFRFAHNFILFFMLVLLGILWHTLLVTKNERRNSIATGKADFTSGQIGEGITPTSFLQRLKVCYLNNYKANPQFNECRGIGCGIAGDISLVFLAMLIIATIRSIILKEAIMCTEESSDYGWSMWVILVTQFVFIIIGSFGSGFRKWTMLYHTDLRPSKRRLIEEPHRSNPLLKSKLVKLIVVVEILCSFMLESHFMLVSLVRICTWILSSMKRAFIRVFVIVRYYTDSGHAWINRSEEFQSYSEFRHGLYHRDEHWMMRKGASSRERLIEGIKRKSNGLCDLLSSIISVHAVIGRFDMARYQEPTEEIQLPPVSLHPLVVLVRLVEVAIPKSPSQDRIVKTFRQAFETLHFIEKHTHNMTVGDLKETELAKALWKAGGFGRLLPVNLRSSDQLSPPVDHVNLRSSDQLSPPVDHAFRVMDCIYLKMGEKTDHMDSVSHTVNLIKVFLEKRTYSSVDELGNFMQDLFGSMLNAMLAQLPEAIFKAVSQSPEDEFEKRVRQSLKHLSMLQSWHGIHKWELPQGLENCTGLLDPEDPAPVSQNDTPSFEVPGNPPV